MNTILLTEAQIRDCVSTTPTFDREAISAVAEAFTALAGGKAISPFPLRLDVPEHEGRVDVRAAYVRGLGGLAVKVDAGFFDNHCLGLPTRSGVTVVLSARTGMPQAVLLDNGYLTGVRAGAAGALAARYLAREDVDTAGVVGAGAQARYQIMGLKQVRDFRRLMVYSLLPQEIERYAEEMTARLGVEVVRAEDVETVVRRSDVVVTCTPTRRPYLKAEWLHPGLHVTAVGADTQEKRELYTDVLGQADLLACAGKSQAFRLGELYHGLEEGIISRQDPIVELGELTAGQHPGRRDDDQITVCVLTSVGVQDAAIALLVYRRAMQKGLGLRLQS